MSVCKGKKKSVQVQPVRNGKIERRISVHRPSLKEKTFYFYFSLLVFHNAIGIKIPNMG